MAVGDWVAADILPLAFAAVLMFALAGWLLARAAGHRIHLAFGVLFVTRGAGHLVEALWTNEGSLTIRQDGAHHILPVVDIIVLFAALWFLWVYLAENRVSWVQHRQAGPILIGLGAFVLLLYALRPELWWLQTGTTPAGDFVARPGGPLFAVSGLLFPIYATIAYILMRESTRDLPEARSRGAYMSGLGFLFLPVFVAAGDLFFVVVWDWFGVVGRDVASLGVGAHLGFAFVAAAIVPIVGCGVELLGAWDRPGGRRRFFGYLGALVFPVATVGVAGAVMHTGPDAVASAVAAFDIYIVFQGIWAIPYPALVAYGILHYQAEEKRTRLLRQWRRFAQTALFFSISFAVTEGIEALASSRFGTWIGLATAAVLTMATQPLQSKVEDVVASRGETPKEVAFYREQLRKTLEDGSIRETERRFLDNLRETMGIQQETARALEAELRREILPARGTTRDHLP